MNIAGNLLISPPSIRGSFWEKTVIFVTEHHSKGTVGLVLNKKSPMTITEFALQHNINFDVPGYIHIGGPVNVKAFTMLHTSEWKCSNTLRINDNYSLSSSGDILNNLAMGNCPRQWRLFVGLAGWTPGKLENEIKGIPPYNHSQSWLISSANLDLVFEKNEQTQWAESIELAGTEFVQNLLV